MKNIKIYLLILITLFICLLSYGQDKSFSHAFGEYKVLWSQNEAFIKVVHGDGAQGYMKWTPGGGSQPFLDAGNISQITDTDSDIGKGIAIKGSLSWADYTIDINIPDLSKGDIAISLSLALKTSLDANSSLFSSPKPEWELIAPSGNIAQPIYYFNGPIPLENWADYSTMDRWFDRSDLNQLVYFGDNQVMKSTVLLYEDFTSMNKWFELSGNNILTKFELWEKHVDDIIRQPSGSLNTPQSNKYEFGLVLHTPKTAIPSGSAFVLSSAMVSLKPDVFSMEQASEHSQRFVESYADIYSMLEKPEAKFHNWVDLSRNLITEIESKGEKDLLTAQHFNMKPVLQYLRNYDNSRVEYYMLKAFKETAASLRPNYKNKNGIGLGFGWMDDWKMGASKVDLWQGYFWPIIQCAEWGIQYNEDKIKRDVISTIPFTLATIEQMNYTFSVFVDMNEAKHIKNEANYDFGASGGILYMLLLYRDLLLNDNILPEADKTQLIQKCLDAAEKSADKLISFGFNSGFELNVTAASALGLYRLHEITGKEKYLKGVNTQLAVILKHSWLFNPQYRQYKDRNIFLQSSARANLSYSNAAEETMLIYYLEQLLKAGESKLEPKVAGMISELVRWKCTTIADGIPALHADKSIIHQGIAENLGAIDVNSYVPLEPYGYHGFQSDKGLGFLNHCYYGLGVIPQAALVQFHKLSDNKLLYTEGVSRIFESEGKVWIEAIASREDWNAIAILPVNTVGKYVYVDGFQISEDQSMPQHYKFALKPGLKHELIITDLPFILQHPVSQELIVTIDDARLEVVVNGNNLTYQWYKNDGAISGANSAKYEISKTDLKLTDSGKYYCIISNDRGSAKSNEAIVTVHDASLVLSTEINDKNWDIKEPYLVAEDYTDHTIKLKVNTIAGCTVWYNKELCVDNIITIDVDRPSVQNIEYEVKAPNGVDYLTFELAVEKRFNFEDIVINRWNNTLIVNNNSATNGGYKFIAYKWFMNDVEVGAKQYFSAGPKKSSILNYNALYNVDLITEDKTVLRTWKKYISLKEPRVVVNPNPVRAGGNAVLELSMDDEMLEKATFDIYDMNGMNIKNEKISGVQTTIQVPTNPGLYVITVKSKNFTHEQKIIVK